MQKLFVYVDESGQDPTSKHFIVVAVVCIKDHDELRNELVAIESLAKTHGLKWQKTQHDRRIRYLSFVLDRKLGAGSVYIGVYSKPVPYFSPVLYVTEKAITHEAKGRYRATVRVDGINRKIAQSLTNALRAQGVSARMVKGVTDEAEPIVRLADMWAGCIRSAYLNEKDAIELLKCAKQSGYLREVTI